MWLVLGYVLYVSFGFLVLVNVFSQVELGFVSFPIFFCSGLCVLGTL
jgi:hypothetical protein